MSTFGRPKFIVGIGGSAGGLVAYEALLSSLACHTGMAFVIVTHMLPTAESTLATILSRYTKMPVRVIDKVMRIQPNHIYVNPPNMNVFIEGQGFKLVSPRTRNKEIDLFLTSLAEDMGPGAIGIILSGYDADGAQGCKLIKAKGGTTFAQDESAEVDNMPLSAQYLGCIDFVLAPDKIADKLEKLARIPKNEGKKRRSSS